MFLHLPASQTGSTLALSLNLTLGARQSRPEFAYLDVSVALCGKPPGRRIFPLPFLDMRTGKRGSLLCCWTRVAVDQANYTPCHNLRYEGSRLAAPTFEAAM